jgi:N-acetylneuraminate synthase
MSIYCIAEIGINHNGDLDITKKLIDVAADAGADAVKFQKRDIDSVYTQEFLEGARESQWGTTQREQKMGLEFGEEEYAAIDTYCKEKNIDWFGSAWDMKSIEFLDKFDLKYHKIASAMIVDHEFLNAIAKRGLHTFISTGMTDEKMIDDAVEIFRNHECSFELMHCISTYPMLTEDANLNCINTLKEKYNCNVGYSGHESGGLAISYAAAGMGISSLERHITLDRSMYGSDQSASIEPAGFQMLIGGIREIEKAKGDGKIEFLEKEKPIAENLRQHLKG